MGLDGSLQVVAILFEDHGIVFSRFLCEAEIKFGHVWFASCSGDEIPDYLDQVDWPGRISGYLWAAVIGRRVVVIGRRGAVIVHESTVSAQAWIWGGADSLSLELFLMYSEFVSSVGSPLSGLGWHAMFGKGDLPSRSSAILSSLGCCDLSLLLLFGTATILVCPFARVLPDNQPFCVSFPLAQDEICVLAPGKIFALVVDEISMWGYPALLGWSDEHGLLVFWDYPQGIRWRVGTS